MTRDMPQREFDKAVAADEKRRAERAARFEAAVRDLPDYMLSDYDQQTTVSELASTCRTQLDLIEEGQDSAEGLDPKPLVAWLRKYAPSTLAKTPAR